MNKTTLVSLALLATSGIAMADITVNVSPAVPETSFKVEYGYLSDIVKPRKTRPEAHTADLTVTDGKFSIPVLPDGMAQYVIPTGYREYIMLYAAPDENLTVDIESTNPLSYKVTGTRLMEDVSNLDMESSKIMEEYKAIAAAGEPTKEDMDRIDKAYNKIFTDFIAANPDALAVPYAVIHLEGEDFMDAYNAMTPAAKESPIAIFLEPQKQRVERQLAAIKLKKELTSGQVEAPNFTFNNVEGKPVSLSDFRGKWVIIDFWGSWCPWCIKGFPKLKEAYAKYKPELEVIGVACRDPYQAWVNALKKYELPWVNVYNPEEDGGQLIKDYAVEGFPTKVIVSPEGKIMNITAGEDPSFYETLANLIKK